MSHEAQVKVGMVYSCKVGGSFLPVRIDKSLGHGRYEGAAMPSGKTVKISTDAIRGDGESVEKWEARRVPKEHDLPAPAPENGPTVAAKGKRTPKPKEPKERKPGGLDAAVRVLREAGTPMNCGDIVKTALEKGYWQTNGRTPASTIYAAIITEIAKKGQQSRFRKVDRGLFELTVAAKEVK
jgi:hypothetical protein